MKVLVDNKLVEAKSLIILDKNSSPINVIAETDEGIWRADVEDANFNNLITSLGLGLILPQVTEMKVE